MVVVCFPSTQLDMPARIRKMAWKYRLSYTATFGVLLYMVMQERKTDLWLRDGSANAAVMTPFLFFVVLGFTTFFLIQGSDPGYLGADVADLRSGDHLLELSDDEMWDESDEEEEERGAAVSAERGGRPEEGSGREERGGEGVAAAGAASAEEAPATTTAAENEIPLRAKYCRVSQRYVATYDHFCGILGTCIGERNRCRFWVFLLSHSILVWWAVGLAFSGTRYRRTWSDWWSENGYAVFLLVVFWLLFALVSGLLVWHTWLLATNSTQYEFMKQRRLPHLRKFRICDLPFSEGLAANLRFCCCSDALWTLCFPHKWTPRRWEEPAQFDRNSTDCWANPWENAYWSCC